MPVFQIQRSGAAPLERAACRPPHSSPLRLIVVLNEKRLEWMGDGGTQEQAFAHANDVLKHAAGGVSDIVHIPDAGQTSTSKT